MEPAFAVLSPEGRDETRIFSRGAGLPSDPGHPPINYHAYAASCGGGFYRRCWEVPDAVRQVLILLRKDGLDHALHAARTLRGLGMRVLVSWKESGLPQVARVLAQPRLYQRFRTICGEADGFISSTMDLLPLYEAAGCSGRFIPTPYPTEESAWDFSIPIRQRRGVFIGTREFGIPSRNHLLAVSCASRFGHPVTVVNTEGWSGSRLLRSISDEIRIIPGKLPYAAYLGLLAQHRIVFQLDRSAVPGQVAGDALLCGLPCVGGDGAVDRLVFPDLSGANRTIGSALEVARRLLTDDGFYAEVFEKARALALERLCFSKVKEQLLAGFS